MERSFDAVTDHTGAQGNETRRKTKSRGHLENCRCPKIAVPKIIPLKTAKSNTKMKQFQFPGQVAAYLV